MNHLPANLRGRPDRLTQFSDETSLDTRTTSGYKVSLYATIRGDVSIDWYYALRSHFPHAPEVKSTILLAAFESLPTAIQARVWSGLRHAVIQIADVRPYRGRLEHGFLESTGKPLPHDLLREAVQRGDRHAAKIIAMADRLVAHQMLLDSFGARLQGLLSMAGNHAWATLRSVEPGTDLVPPELGKGKISSDRMVTEYTAKDNTAFVRAFERAVTNRGESEQRRYFLGPNLTDLIFRGTLAALQDGHAFDEGSARILADIEKRRRGMVQKLLGGAGDGRDSMTDENVPALVEVDSQADSRIQAADVAAGFARHHFAREGLSGVVGRWEAVYYNGGRLTENNLGAATRFWNSVQPR